MNKKLINYTVGNEPEYKNNTWNDICNNRIATFNWIDQIPDASVIKKVR